MKKKRAAILIFGPSEDDISLRILFANILIFKAKKSRKVEICHIRFFIYQNPCLGMVKSLSWAVTKYCVEVGWPVTKYQVEVG